MRHSWLREFARRFFGTSRRSRGTIARRKPADRPTLEALEIRVVPAGSVVAVGQENNLTAFRSTSVAKLHDPNANNVYGEDGYIFYGIDNHPTPNADAPQFSYPTDPLNPALSLPYQNVQSVPGYLTLSNNGQDGVAAGFSHTNIDDPRVAPASSVAQVESGVALHNFVTIGTEASVLNITINAGFPTAGVRVGVYIGMAEDTMQAVRLAQTVGGFSSAAATRVGSPTTYAEFFDITGASPGDVYTLYLTKGLNDGGTNPNVAYMGLTFDISNDFIVTNTNDSGAGSLRAAITGANASAGPAAIVFDIPGSGVQTIAPTSALPTITNTVTLDATTQPGYSGTPLIQLSGAGAGSGANGLTVTANNSTIKGLVINGFSGDGIALAGSGNLIAGNYVGTNAGGNSFIPNTVAWFKGDGNANDTVGGDNGTLNGGVGFAAGEVGQAFNFPGNVGDYVRVPDVAALDPATTLSVDFWVKGPAPVGYLLAKGAGSASSAAYAFYTLTGGLQFYVRTPSGTFLSPNEGPSVWDNNWHHVTGTYDGSTVRLYVDGAQVGTGTAASGSISYDDGAGDTRDLFIGNYPLDPTYPTGSFPFKGEIDEVGVYNRALTAAEDHAIFAAGSAGKPADFGNHLNGISITGGASGNTVGGTAAGAGNLVSSNVGGGVYLSGPGTSGNLVAGNLVGTNAGGTAALGNAHTGVGIFGGANANTVGGTTATARNVISANGVAGVYVHDAGSSANLIEGNYLGTDINGTAPLGNDSYGLLIGAAATGNTVGGTTAAARNVISGNRAQGVRIVGGGTSGNLLAGNYVGTDASGTVPLGNAREGVLIDNGPTGNTVGGTAAGAGNVVSANGNGGVYLFGGGTSGNVVAGNLIGTDKNGTAALGNSGTGVRVFGGASGNTIGGTTAAARNVVSASTAFGVFIHDAGTSGNLVEGNYVGTDVTGTAPMGNTLDGVLISLGAAANTVGGTTAAARNVISANARYGVQITDSGTSGNMVEGDYVGTDTNGTARLGNANVGVLITGGASGNTVGGTAAGAGNVVSANGNAVNFTGGVYLTGGASGNVVAGNLIGTDKSGTLALGNNWDGVGLDTGAAGNTIGGTAPGAGNVISANAAIGVEVHDAGSSANLIAGNLIGTDVTGTVALGNSSAGVLLRLGTTGNTVGGTTTAARNVISGNDTFGVRIANAGTTGNVVAGDYIGTDASGTFALPNGTSGAGFAGVLIDAGAAGNTVGGSAAGAGNVIAGNHGDGIDIVNGATPTSGNVVAGNYVGVGRSGTGLIPGTVAWYPFNGNLNDVVGGLNGTPHNSSTPPLFVPGEVGQAAQFTTDSGFNGPDRSFSVPDTTPTTPTALEPASALTVETWLNSSNPFPNNGVNGVVYLLSKGENTEEHNSYALTALNVGGTEQLEFSIFTTGNDTYTVSTTASPFDGNWHHVAARFNGATISLYVDGTLAGSTPVSDGKPIQYDLTDSTLPSSGGLNSNDLSVGGSVDDSIPLLYNGELDELGIYNRALSPSEIQAIYGAGSHGKSYNVGNTANGVNVNAPGNTIGGVAAPAQQPLLSSAGLTNPLFLVRAPGGALYFDDQATNIIYRIDPNSGARTVLSSGGLLTGAEALAYDPVLNALVVSNYDNNTNSGNLVRINLATGQQTLVTPSPIPTEPDGVAVAPNGTYLVSCFDFTTETSHVVQVNPGTGAQTPLGGSIAGQVNDIAVSSAGQIYLTDLVSFAPQASDVLAVNPVNGTTTVVSSGGDLDYAGGLTVRPDGTLVTAVQEPAVGGGPSTGELVEVDPETGTQTVLSSGGNLIDTVDVAAEPNGDLLAVNGLFHPAPFAVVRVEVNPARNVISGNATGDGVLLAAPSNTVQGNYIGADATGNAGLGNADDVLVTTPGNTIGGTVAGAGNVISASLGRGIEFYNATFGAGPSPATSLVAGNTIGLGADGSTALGNHLYGIYVALDSRNVIIGGSTAAARNVIANNVGFGIITDVAADGLTIQGNYIGVDAGGINARPNGNGIETFSSHVTIGGPTATPGTGPGNVIAANGVGPTTGVGIGVNGASGVTIQGNIIGLAADGLTVPNNFQAEGIRLSGTTGVTVGGAAAGSRNLISGNFVGVGIDTTATGNVVAGNYIGTDISGTLPRANTNSGVSISTGAFGNTIGGTTALARNVISGNTADGVDIQDAGTSGNVVEGNYIGTNASGTSALGNANGLGITDASNNTIGGTTAGARNVLSGNASDGAFVFGTASGNVIEGNYIGVGASGTLAVPNAFYGVQFGGAVSGNTLGGAAVGARNIVAGNTAYGVVVGSTSPAGNAVQGNWIGLAADGSTPLGNGTAGVLVGLSPNNTIGGTAAGAGNVISGNFRGIWVLTSSGAVIQGNSVGTDPTGTLARGNVAGIDVDQSSNSTIGGTTAAARNVISGNTADGLSIHASGTTGNLVEGNYIGVDANGTGLIPNTVSWWKAEGNANDSVDGNNGTPVNGATFAPGMVGQAFSLNGSGAYVDVGNASNLNVSGGAFTAEAWVKFNAVSGDMSILDKMSGNGVVNSDGWRLLKQFDNHFWFAFGGGTTNGASAGAPTTVISTTTATTGVWYHVAAVKSSTEIAIYVNGVKEASKPVPTFTDTNSTDLLIGSNVREGAYLNGLVDESAIYNRALTATEIQGVYNAGSTGKGNAVGNALNGVEIAAGAANNTIGGASASARNVISGNAGIGVVVLGSGTTNNVVEGNYVGANASGSAALGNHAGGVDLQDAVFTTVGGTAAGAGNVISGNVGDGVDLTGTASNNTVLGNLIGTTAAGSAALSNTTDGVAIAGGHGNLIGGTAAGARNVISGNGRYGVSSSSHDVAGNTLQGNTIGLDAGGTVALPNAFAGVLFNGSPNNTIGGAAAGAGNVISGNNGNGGNGVWITGSASGNVVQGNLIGTDASGTLARGNGLGVAVDAGSNHNTIGGIAAGMANTIAFNTIDGVAINGAASTGNVVRANSIHDNAGPGIHLTNGGDNGQAAPVLTVGSLVPGLPTTVSGSLTSAPSTAYALDFYANNAAGSGGFGQGQFFLGSLNLVTDATGSALFTASMLGSTLPGQVVSATATSAAAGNTSQFDADVGVSGYTNTNPVVTIVGPATAIAGAPVSLTSTLSDATKNKTYTYAWAVTQPANSAFTLPATTVIDEPTLVFTPPTPGTYVASLIVKDNLGGSTTATLTLVARVPGPGVVITGAPGLPVAVGKPLTLTSTVVEPTGATTTSRAWSVTINNGQPYPLPPATITNAQTFTFTPTVNGLYEIGIVAIDSAGAASSTSVFVLATGTAPPPPPPPAPANAAPKAAITSAPAGGLVGQTIALTGTVSAGATPQWSVTLNGQPYSPGTATNQSSFHFIPAQSGVYMVTLTATDTAGHKASVSAKVPVNPTVVPVALAAVGAPFEAGIAARLAAKVNSTVPGVTYTFAWTVNGSPAAGTTSAFTFTPASPGSYTVAVTATGADGSTGSASLKIAVAPPLTAAVTEQGGAANARPLGTPVKYTAQIGGGTGSVKYTWSVTLNGNPYALPTGTVTHAPTFSLTPDRLGTFAVTLAVSDAAGGSATAADSFTAQPAILFGSVSVGGTSFTASLSTVAPTLGSGHTITYDWAAFDHNNGLVAQVLASLSPAFSFTGSTASQLNPYSVTLTVYDNNVAVGTASQALGFAAANTTIDASAMTTPVLLVAAGGHDILIGGAGPSVLVGDTGNNLLQGGSGPATLLGTGNDTLVGGTGASNLFRIAAGGSEMATAGTQGNTLDLTQFTAGATVNFAAPNNTTQSVSTGTSLTLSGTFQAVVGTNLTVMGASSITMFGGGGSDSLTSSGGTSITMVGGGGSDTLSALNGSNVVLQAGSGNATLMASGGSSITMFGGGGNDSLSSSGGSSITMMGGGGNETLSSSGGSSITMFGGGGNDSLSSSGGTGISMMGGSGNSTLSSGSGGSSITMFGGTGNDSLSSSGSTSISMISGGGNDTLTSSGGTSITMFGGGGNDSIQSSGGTSVTMVGGGGNETLSSSGGSSITMFGGTGNDSLQSSGGTSISMVSGGGNDTLTSSGGSSITMFGGGGNDSLSSSGGTSVTMVGGSGNETLSSSSGGSSITMFGGSGNDSLSSSGGTSISMVSGGGNDTLTSSGGTSITMFGGGGNDSLSSSGGTNITMVGGSGNETLSSSSSGGSSITMFGGSGNDSLSSSGGTSISMVSGGGNDTITSSGGSSITMFGGGGNDSLSSSGGTNVTMVGGSGNETLSSSSGGSSITMFGGSGNDSLSSSGGTSISMVAGSGNDTLSSSGGTSITMFGGSGNDSLQSSGGTSVTMVGGSGNETLSSSGGSSITLFGGSGNDSLNSTGGTGVTMVGGSGNDSLSTSNGNSVLVLGSNQVPSVTSLTATLSGSTYTFTAAVSGNPPATGTPTGSVDFFDTTTHTDLGNVTLVGGSATLAAPAAAAGDGVSATYGGDIGFATSSATQTLGTGLTTTLLTSSTTGANVSFSAAVSADAGGGPPTGTVVFADATTGGNLGSVALVGGSASSAPVAAASVAGHRITATYAPNPTSFAASSASQSIVGNSTLSSSGGSSITLFGGSGNDSLMSSGGTSVTLIGGSGNDTLTGSGGSSITLFGGSGNDSLNSSGGTSVTLIGGSGNDTLSSTNGSNVSILGGSGNDTLTSSGGTSITMFGGTGNDSLASSGGSSVTMVGGSGNDTLSSSGATSATIIGGTGNDTLTNTGGASITMFGGTGNDSLSSSGGTSVSIIGGSGNDTLSSSGETNATLQGGGSGSDSLMSSGGSSVTLFGGAGNDTLVANGGTAVGLYGLQGNNVYAITGPITAALNDLATFGQNQPQTDSQTLGINTITFPGLSNLHAGQPGIHIDLSNTSPGPIPVLSTDPGQPQTVAPGITLSLTGQFQNVVGTPGDDSIKGDASSNLLDGGGGNDTLIGGSGPATLVAGSGNDTLVAGSGGTTFRFAGSPNSFGSDAIDPPAGAALNLLDFSQFGGPVTLNLGLSGAQRVSGTSGLTLTLQTPAAINAVADSASFNDSITGNASGDTFFVGGTGNDTFTGGGGADSFFFSGSQLGTADVIAEPPTSTNNALSFRGFAGPVNLNLNLTTKQTLGQGSASTLGLTLTNPAAFDVVVGSPYGGSLQGNNDPNETLIGGGGLDSLAAGSGNDYVQNYVTQVVSLDFSNAPAGDHVYSPAEQLAILQGLQRVYAGLNYFFTLSPADAAQQAQVTGGAYATLRFNAGNAGGASNQLDPSNLSLGGTTLINVNPFLGDAANGLVPPTSANIVGLTTTIAAHELGHLSGLQHQDAFGPIGTSTTPTGIYAGVRPSEFRPTFPGPQNATQTPFDVMASPASVGTTLLQAAGAFGPTYVGERDAIKLAFNKYGTVLQQANLLPTQQAVTPSSTVPTGAVVLPDAGTIYPVGNLQQLPVPNTLPPGTRDYGQAFNVTAAAVNATVTPGQGVQYFSFNGTAGQVMTFQIISNNNTLNTRPVLIPALEVLDHSGNIVPYYGDTTNAAFNVHEFESNDSTLLDVVLPSSGTFYVGVLDVLSVASANYQLFMYSFATGTPAIAPKGDTLVAGSGHDTLVGTQGIDQFLNAGSNVIQNTNASPTTTTLTGPAVNPSIYGQPVTFSATVAAANGAVPIGSVQFLDTTTGQVLGTVPLSATGQASLATGTGSAALGAGTQVIRAIYVSSNTNTFTGSSSQDTNTDVTQVVTLAPTGTTAVYVLNPTAAGALSMSGNAKLQVTGVVDVDSSSTSAISASGNAQISADNTAGSIKVVGKVQSNGNAKLSPTPVTGAGTFGDPLGNLPVPVAGGTALSINLSGNGSQLIYPGLYSKISVSGNASLTMSPGVYVIAGGGFSVTGNANVSGSGVMIYNAGSNYPNTGGSFGGVNLSGNGKISLTPPGSGSPYAGVLIFQARDDTAPLALSGNGMALPGGVIYAANPAAQLTMSGNGQFKGSLVVGTLTVSGNAIAQLSAGGGGTAVYAPAQVRTAYGINNLSLDGTGQTIAIVDAYDNPAIYQALDAFDAQFGMASGGSTLGQLYGPAASFLTVFNQQGQTTSLPATDPVGPGSDNWEVETALDVEWTHAVAPGAKIVLVEAGSQSLADLMTAVKTAAGLPGVSVVSMSWGFPEGQDVLARDEATYDPYFTTPAGHTGVTFVASTGDYGAGVLEYPAFSPNVVAVGGTSLTLSADNSYKSETGWGSYSSALGTFLGSGGGLSQFESEPAYQKGVQSTGSRTTPDVSLLADPATGVWVADPYNLSGDNPWEVVGGTSLSAPAWAGLLAVADQGRVAVGEATLGTAGPTEAQSALYGLSRADYHDVTSGGNGYSAGAGYDLVTGLGSPVADLLIPDLVAYSGGPVSSTPVAPIAASGLVPSGDGGSGGGSVAAALRVFSARALSGRVAPPGVGGGSDSALLNSEARPTKVSRSTPALAAADGTGAADAAGSRVAAPAGLSLNLGGADLAGVAPSAAGGTAQAGRRWNESASGANGAPAWSPVLLDVSSAIGLVPAAVTGALRPEMPADGGRDVLVGGAGDDLLVGGEGRDLLVGGYAAGRGATVIDGLPDSRGAALDAQAAGGRADDAGSRFSDDYFVQNSGDAGEGGGGVP